MTFFRASIARRTAPTSPTAASAADSTPVGSKSVSDDIFRGVQIDPISSKMTAVTRSAIVWITPHDQWNGKLQAVMRIPSTIL